MVGWLCWGGGNKIVQCAQNTVDGVKRTEKKDGVGGAGDREMAWSK